MMLILLSRISEIVNMVGSSEVYCVVSCVHMLTIDSSLWCLSWIGG